MKNKVSNYDGELVVTRTKKRIKAKTMKNIEIGYDPTDAREKPFYLYVNGEEVGWYAHEAHLLGGIHQQLNETPFRQSVIKMLWELSDAILSDPEKTHLRIAEESLFTPAFEGRLVVTELPQLDTITKPFKDLEIGDRFHLGYCAFSGFNKGEYGYYVYEKTSKSKATVREQHGYKNFRGVGNVKCCGPYLTVCAFKKD
jgi:hypothetical protein